MEQKTWQVYNSGKRNVVRLDLNESREGFCLIDNTAITTTTRTIATTTTTTTTTNNNNNNGSLECLTRTDPARIQHVEVSFTRKARS